MFVVSAVANSPRGQVLQEDESQSAMLLTSAFEAARGSAAVKHLWPGLRPQWTTIYSTLRLEWPGVYDPSVLHGKFFDNVGQSDHTIENLVFNLFGDRSQARAGGLASYFPGMSR